MKNRRKTVNPRTAPNALATACLTALSLIAASLVAEVPEKPDPGLVSVGRTAYTDYCSSCHGAGGRGDGPKANGLRPRPADLTLIARGAGRFPFDQVVEKIDGREKVTGHGSSDMPVWGEAFKQAEGGSDEDAVESKIHALAHYLWSIQAEAEAES